MKLNGLEKYFKTDKLIGGKIIDFKQKFNDFTPLMFAFRLNKNFNTEQWDYLIKNSDLTQVDNLGNSPFMYALEYNKSKKLNFSAQQWDYLIKNTDSNNPHFLSYIFQNFICNHKFNFTKEQYEYILKKSDLNIYLNNTPLIKTILENSLFLNEIGEKNTHYLKFNFPQFINKTIENKIISLEEDIKNLKKKLEEQNLIII